jgi:hypothetical protein
MKKVIFAAIIVLAYATLAFSGTAKWTGNQIPLPASSGYTAKCEYAQGIVKFWRLTNEACKPTVETTSGALPPTATKGKQGQHTPAKMTYP